MSEYNQFVTAINKTFELLAKMKENWNNLDNHNYIDSIEEYKQTINNVAALINGKAPEAKKENEHVEALGDD